MFDGEAFGTQMVEIVRGYVDGELGPLRAENKALAEANAGLIERVTALEAKKIEPAPEVDLAVVREMIDTAISTLPVPQDGESVTLADVQPVIDEAVARAVADIPAPRDGESVTIDDVAPIITEAVERAVAALPSPRDGENGVGLADAFIDQDGALVVTMTDGRAKALGVVKGEPGKPGENGFDLDDFDITPISERTIEMSFTRGDTKHTYELEFPVIVYREVYAEGEAYVRGDAVTWGGSLWIAQCSTSSKPDAPDSGWKLAVKRGRDGKNAQ